MLWFWTDTVGFFDPRKVTNNICQPWNKHAGMFCMPEVVSPELDLILPKLAHAMLKSGGWSVPGTGLGLFLQGIPHSQPVPLICACGTVVLVQLSERSRMAFTLGIVPGPSPPWLYKHSKKFFLCCSVLIVTRSGSIRQQRLLRVVSYKTITIRTLTSLKYFIIVHWEECTTLCGTNLVRYHGELGC